MKLGRSDGTTYMDIFEEKKKFTEKGFIFLEMEVIYEGDYPEVFECNVSGLNSPGGSEGQGGYQYTSSSDSEDENQPSVTEMKSIDQGDNSDVDSCVGDETPDLDEGQYTCINSEEGQYSKEGQYIEEGQYSKEKQYIEEGQYIKGGQYSFDVYKYSDEEDDGFENFKEKVIV